MDCYFFGSFNPIHLGHIEIARRIKEKLGFDKVIFVPSFMPPHKVDGLISYSDRLNMVRLAVGDENVSDIESKIRVPSYTYRTIEKLFEDKNYTDKDKINFIIGYDQFFALESWREPEILKQKLHFIVYPRKFANGQTVTSRAFDYFRNKNYDFEIFEMDFLDISSSQIRKCLENNDDITGLTTREVKEYIENNRLYKKLAEGKFIR